MLCFLWLPATVYGGFHFIHFDLVRRCSCSSSFPKSDLSWCCSSNLIKDNTDISLLYVKICFVNGFFPLWYTIMGVLIKAMRHFKCFVWLMSTSERESRLYSMSSHQMRWHHVDIIRLASVLMLTKSSFYLIAFHFHANAPYILHLQLAKQLRNTSEYAVIFCVCNESRLIIWVFAKSSAAICVRY